MVEAAGAAEARAGEEAAAAAAGLDMRERWRKRTTTNGFRRKADTTRFTIDAPNVGIQQCLFKRGKSVRKKQSKESAFFEFWFFWKLVQGTKQESGDESNSAHIVFFFILLGKDVLPRLTKLQHTMTQGT
jgi:hypothetical protein